MRNDYPLLALWEMGVKHLRIPPSDLLDEHRRKRLQDLWHLRFRFTLFSAASQLEGLIDTVKQHQNLIHRWEISGHVADAVHSVERFRSNLDEIDVPLLFSPLRSKADILRFKNTYYHVINHGYTARESVEELLNAMGPVSENFDGVIFRCGFEDSVFNTISVAKDLGRQTGLTVSVHLRLAGDNPAAYVDQEKVACRRLAEAMILAWCNNFEQIYCDTLTDNDRGYFPRLGVLDRKFNPRNGAKLVKCMHSLFAQCGEVQSWSKTSKEDGVELIEVRTRSRKICVYLTSDNLRNKFVKDAATEFSGDWLDWKEGKMSNEIPPYHDYPQLCITRMDGRLRS